MMAIGAYASRYSVVKRPGQGSVHSLKAHGDQTSIAAAAPCRGQATEVLMLILSEKKFNIVEPSQNCHEHEQLERNCTTTSKQPAWLVSVDLCSCPGPMDSTSSWMHMPDSRAGIRSKGEPYCRTGAQVMFL